MNEDFYFFCGILNIRCASITSKTLFINVAESIEIFFPIDQFGCFNALFKDAFLIFFICQCKNGPPEAVIIMLSILLELLLFNKDQIEKCSESTGIN